MTFLNIMNLPFNLSAFLSGKIRKKGLQDHRPGSIGSYTFAGLNVLQSVSSLFEAFVPL